MKVIIYTDVFTWSTGKGDLFFTYEQNLQVKPPDAKRYKIIIELPDQKMVDETIKNCEVNEVK